MKALIIGYGSIGSRHANIISEMPEFPGKIENVDTTPKQDEDIHFVLAVNGTEDTIFAAVDGHAVPIEEMNKEEPKIETSEERDARYHLKVKQSDQYERLWCLYVFVPESHRDRAGKICESVFGESNAMVDGKS